MAVNFEVGTAQVADQGDTGLFTELDGPVGRGSARCDQPDTEAGSFGYHFSGNPSGCDQHLVPKIDLTKQGFAGQTIKGVVATDILCVKQQTVLIADGR